MSSRAPSKHIARPKILFVASVQCLHLRKVEDGAQSNQEPSYSLAQV
jgi:hypothetical protein